MAFSRSRLPPRILDVVLFLSRKFTASQPPTWSMVILLLCTYSGLIPARTPGFDCNDQSIRRSFSGNTVGTAELLIGSLLGPLFFFFIVEFLHLKCESRILDAEFFKRGARRSLAVWRSYMIGQLFVLTSVEVSKTIISEPRPHFIETCQPNITVESCLESPYVTNYKCISGNKTKKISDSQKSFPSGHASVSMFAASYMIWYLHYRISWTGNHLLKPVLQLLWVLFAALCSLTRIIDNRHHWWDVLAGAVLGLFINIIVTKQPASKKWDGSEELYTKDVSSLDGPLSGGSDISPGGVSHTSPAPKGKHSEKRPSVRRLLSASSFSCDPDGNEMK